MPRSPKVARWFAWKNGSVDVVRVTSYRMESQWANTQEGRLTYLQFRSDVRYKTEVDAAIMYAK